MRAVDAAARVEQEQSDIVRISNPIAVNIFALARLPGVYNHPPGPCAAADQLDKTLFRLKTADEMIFDMHSLINAAVNRSGGKFRPTHMRLPLAVYNHAATRRMGDGSNQTVLAFFLATAAYVRTVEPTWQLDAQHAHSWNPAGPQVSRVIVYQDNPGKFVEVDGESMPCPESVAFMDGLSDLQD